MTKYERLMKYVITAENRLTGEREVICKPHDYLTTQGMLIRWQAKFRRKRRAAWLHLRMEGWPREPERLESANV